MASYNGRYELELVDINGDTAQMKLPFHGPDTDTLAGLVTGLNNLVTAISAATNCKVIRTSLYVLVNQAQYLVGTAPPTNAEYSSVTDGAKFSFSCATGERSSATIPAPIEALFGVNSNVVDSTQTQAAAFIAAFEAACAAPSGTVYNLYEGGVKVGRHSRRRVTKRLP